MQKQSCASRRERGRRRRSHVTVTKLQVTDTTVSWTLYLYPPVPHPLSLKVSVPPHPVDLPSPASYVWKHPLFFLMIVLCLLQFTIGSQSWTRCPFDDSRFQGSFFSPIHHKIISTFSRTLLLELHHINASSATVSSLGCGSSRSGPCEVVVEGERHIFFEPVREVCRMPWSRRTHRARSRCHTPAKTTPHLLWMWNSARNVSVFTKHISLLGDWLNQWRSLS